MRKQKFFASIVCSILLIALIGCGPTPALAPAADTAGETATEAEAEAATEPESTEAPAQDVAAESSEAAMEEAVAATFSYESYPPEWVDRTTLGNPDATVLVEAYEEFM